MMTVEEVYQNGWIGKSKAFTECPWMLTKVSYADIGTPMLREPKEQDKIFNRLLKKHKKIIKKAIEDGIEVPDFVLADYPNLEEKDA